MCSKEPHGTMFEAQLASTTTSILSVVAHQSAVRIDVKQLNVNDQLVGRLRDQLDFGNGRVIYNSDLFRFPRGHRFGCSVYPDITFGQTT